MTCFWQGIIKTLDDNLYNKIHVQKKSNINSLIKWLMEEGKKYKSKNIHLQVKWQNKLITKQLSDELLDSIINYKINNIHNGHLTSTCDAFLCLLCHIFKISIIHNYNKYLIKYDYNGKTNQLLKYSSNKYHFIALI